MTESTILDDRITAAKSDQLNADDLVGRELEGTITAVILRGIADQPVHIVIDGDTKKPWKPCKTMTRVLKEAWANDTAMWIGQRVRLFNDPKVKWGGVEVGGIRIKGLSGIPEDRTFAVSETKGKRNPMRVRLLEGAAARTGKVAEKKPDVSADEARAKALAWATTVTAPLVNMSLEEIDALAAKHADSLVRLHAKFPDIALLINDAIATARNEASKE